jgi:hypothetical protein
MAKIVPIQAVSIGRTGKFVRTNLAIIEVLELCRRNVRFQFWNQDSRFEIRVPELKQRSK